MPPFSTTVHTSPLDVKRRGRAQRRNPYQFRLQSASGRKDQPQCPQSRLGRGELKHKDQPQRPQSRLGRRPLSDQPLCLRNRQTPRCWLPGMRASVARRQSHPSCQGARNPRLRRCASWEKTTALCSRTSLVVLCVLPGTLCALAGVFAYFAGLLVLTSSSYRKSVHDR